ncbi:MAG: hypothetical protein HRU48_18685 [Vibrio sp.]|uniref:hypothetical protein n=3 Tax=Vibrio TaxID=662 RepID=UPI001EB9CDEA|nr:hypothetical protein [Vibrio sp.]NRB69365.1 hypothetical protein [Vibrio sp.]
MIKLSEHMGLDKKPINLDNNDQSGWKLLIARIKPKTLLGALVFIWTMLSLIGFVVLMWPDNWYKFDWPEQIVDINWMLYISSGVVCFAWLVRKQCSSDEKLSCKELCYSFLGFLMIHGFLFAGVLTLFVQVVHIYNSKEAALHLAVKGKTSRFITGAKPACKGGLYLERFERICYGDKEIWAAAKKGMSVIVIGKFSNVGMDIDEMYLVTNKNYRPRGKVILVPSEHTHVMTYEELPKQDVVASENTGDE